MHEDEAGIRLATAVAGGGGGVTLRGPAQSRVDLVATVAGVVEVRIAALERLNRLDPLEVFTVFDGRSVGPGEMVASVKIGPHLVQGAVLAAGEAIARRGGPLVGVRAFRPVRIAVLVKEHVTGPARTRFEASVRAKADGLGATVGSFAYVPDDGATVTAALAAAVASGPAGADIVLTAGGASTDPGDTFFAAVEALGGRIVRHGVPSHPGSMLWLAVVERAAVVGLPSCGAYSKATAADLLLPRLVAASRPRRRRSPASRTAASWTGTSGSASPPMPATSTHPVAERSGVGSPPMGSDQPPARAAVAATERTRSRADRPEATRSIDGITDVFRDHGYIADRSLATTVFLALELGRPLLLEGEAGVGKTELAKVLAASLGTRLIRLQCYEGLDVNTAVYEWNYPRQMLEIRLLEARGEIDKATAHDIFGPEFLLKRPLLQALEATDGEAPVLLIDEIDRADEEFEAYLLEILSDFQVTVPEIGTIRAEPAAAGRPDVQPDARGPRRAQAPLPLPLDRLPVRGQGVRDRRRARAGRPGSAGPRRRGLRPPPPRRPT